MPLHRMKLFLLLRAQSNTLNAKFRNTVTTVWWCTQQILKTTEQLPFPRRKTTLSTKRLTKKKIGSAIASERENGSSMTKKYRTTQVRFQAIRFRGGDFSNIWRSSLITDSLLRERWSILHNTAVTKQCTKKWPYISNGVFGIVQNHGEKSNVRRY